MEIHKQLVIVVFLLFFSFWGIRSVLYGVKNLYLRKNEKKRRAKGQTFKEWFWYTRYRSEIPKALLWLYFAILIIHPFALVMVSIANYIKPFRTVTSVMTIVLLIFDLTWILFTQILSWKPGSPWSHYEQWISKPPKKKK